MKKFIILFITTISLAACETTLYPDLDQAESVLVIDAWLTNEAKRQEIRVTRSLPYFENRLPELVTGATVQVEDLNTGEVTIFSQGADCYFWEPDTDPFGTVGHQYRLSVTVDGETFEAYSRMGRVPPIDSIAFRYNPANMLIKQDYYTSEFIATDPQGIGDAYWIKVWKNDIFLSKPGELNVVYDASFTPGQSVDGELFILPIRKDFLNPTDQVPGKSSEFLPPYLPGDSIRVEIHSLDPAAYDFLFGVYYHISRPGGFLEIFSLPLANAITNLKNTDPQSAARTVGFFNVSAVSGRTQQLTSEIAQKAQEYAHN